MVTSSSFNIVGYFDLILKVLPVVFFVLCVLDALASAVCLMLLVGEPIAINAMYAAAAVSSFTLTSIAFCVSVMASRGVRPK